jgi:phosphate starvation-inducible protein PhoH
LEQTNTIAMEQVLDHSELFGIMDKNLDTIRDSMDVDMIQRDNQLILKGPDAAKAENVIKEMIGIIDRETLDTRRHTSLP